MVSVGPSPAMGAMVRASSAFAALAALSAGDEEPHAANSSATDSVNRLRDTAKEYAGGTRPSLYQRTLLLRRRVSA